MISKISTNQNISKLLEIFLKTSLKIFGMESDLVLKQIQDCHFQSMS